MCEPNPTCTNLRVVDLKKCLKHLGQDGYSKLRKVELCTLLLGIQAKKQVKGELVQPEAVQREAVQSKVVEFESVDEYLDSRLLNVESLGAGQFEVYGGIDRKTQVPTAIKLIELSTETIPDLFREVYLMQTIAKESPHLTSILGVEHVIIDGWDMVAIDMPKAWGDLKKWLDSPGQGGEKQRELMIQLMYDMACGLTSLHNVGILHLDLKPQNVLITTEAAGLTANLADFGFLQFTPSLFTKAANLNMTKPWRAPEMFLDLPGAVAQPADVWSLGIIYAQMILAHLRGAYQEGWYPGSYTHAILNAVYGVSTGDYVLDVLETGGLKPTQDILDLVQKKEPVKPTQLVEVLDKALQKAKTGEEVFELLMGVKKKQDYKEFKLVWPLLHQMLRLDPQQRPTAPQIVKYFEAKLGMPKKCPSTRQQRPSSKTDAKLSKPEIKVLEIYQVTKRLKEASREAKVPEEKALRQLQDVYASWHRFNNEFKLNDEVYMLGSLLLMIYLRWGGETITTQFQWEILPRDLENQVFNVLLHHITSNTEDLVWSSPPSVI